MSTQPAPAPTPETELQTLNKVLIRTGCKCGKLELAGDALRKKVSIDKNGCWIWKGAITSRGYGSSWFRGKSILAHRFSYLVFKGPIPEGRLVCHSCDTPLCINPDHLFCGTDEDNLRDCYSKDRMPTARPAKVREQIKRMIFPESSPTKLGRYFSVRPQLIARYKYELYGPRQ